MLKQSMIPKSGHRFSDKILLKQGMIPKSGHRFSDKIMLKQGSAAQPSRIVRAPAPFWTVRRRASITPRALQRPAARRGSAPR